LANSPKLNSIFIANRGEIALRIARTARRLGMQVLGAFSSADGGLPHLRLCHRASELTGDPARVYLDIGKVIDAAKKLGADSVHPGYGFLAENEDFATAVESAGMAFIGPTPEQIVALGDKVEARKAALRAGVPIVPGESEAIADKAMAAAIAQRIGFPVLIKAAGGGGGRGMRVVESAAQLDEQLARAQSEAQLAFGDRRVFIEKYIARSRHVEIQILGDGKGQAVSLGERECSIQRRHQKLIEESPTPALPPEVAAKMGALAAQLAASVKYRGAGTMEFIVPYGSTDFYFIEMNTRLQVEHPVTELRTGLDLVEEQIYIASGAGFSSRAAAPKQLAGHAIEARVIAEDPDADFRPSCGKLELAMLPAGPGVRVDSWAEAGLSVSPYYDSLLAKVLAWGQTREEAIGRLHQALNETLIAPVRTTAPYIAKLIVQDEFRSGNYDTGTVARLKAAEKGRDVAPALPEQLAVLAAAEKISRNGKNGVIPRGNPGRQLTQWQRADGQEKI
jgi:acetyl/propionyl-CoA carboxylase alpha subunit